MQGTDARRNKRGSAVMINYELDAGSEDVYQVRDYPHTQYEFQDKE